MMDVKPYKLPKMSSDEVSELLDRERICRIAFKGAEFPYLAPFQYVRMGGALYFHFTDYGRKMGELERVEDAGERADAINRIAEMGRSGLSENFLAAHGFPAENGWETLSEDKPMVILKLERISDTIGLRSPT
jgi:hypothetical protein